MLFCLQSVGTFVLFNTIQQAQRRETTIISTKLNSVSSCATQPLIYGYVFTFVGLKHVKTRVAREDCWQDD